MYVPFNALPADARIWIYQANREFSAQEASAVEAEIAQFVKQWAAHGKQLQASGALLHNRFIVLGADESAEMPSGCSIDSSVQFIRSIESRFQVSLFERTLLAFEEEGTIFTLPLSEVKGAVTAGKLKPETSYFDNMVNTAESLSTHWKKPAAQSWLAKYF